ncbi:MAG: tol-pal system protein YbgF [Deltaproteobacteria bacterium]|nr:tol-pal system protein YbgF [Deltaproteobacteria bacterium]
MATVWCQVSAALVILNAVACAESAEVVELRRLSSQVEAMQRVQAQYDAKMEELANRVYVLSRPQAPPSAPAGAAVPTPPELKVVRLVPQSKNSEGDDRLAASSEDARSADGPAVVIKLAGDGEPEALPVVRVPPPPRLTESGDAAKMFDAALAAYRDGRLDAAYQRFAAFVHRFPAHAAADSAAYWMGECRFDAEEYRKAVDEFGRVLKKFPKSDKAPDALFKIGAAYERLGDAGKARDAFAAVLSTYPKSAVADLARRRIDAADPGSRSNPEGGSSR